MFTILLIYFIYLLNSGPAWGCRQLCKALGVTMEIRGLENIRKEHGSVVLMNHQSALDLCGGYTFVFIKIYTDYNHSFTYSSCLSLACYWPSHSRFEKRGFVSSILWVWILVVGHSLYKQISQNRFNQCLTKGIESHQRKKL